MLIKIRYPNHRHDSVFFCFLFMNFNELKNEICKSLDLRILNGLCKGDSLGKITFHGYQEISTVDYIVISHEILHMFQNFVARQPSPFSDHCQLVSWLNIDISLLNISNEIPEKELFNLPRQFKWNENSKEKFPSALQSPGIRQLISEFESINIEQISNVNEMVDKFGNIFETAAKKLLQLVNIKRKSGKLCSQIWFDHHCQNIRGKLRHISNKKQKNPLNEQTRLEYLSVRRQYKHLLRQKKQKYQNNKLKYKS